MRVLEAAYIAIPEADRPLLSDGPACNCRHLGARHEHIECPLWVEGGRWRMSAIGQKRTSLRQGGNSSDCSDLGEIAYEALRHVVGMDSNELGSAR